jgi:VWFA-related protein
MTPRPMSCPALLLVLFTATATAQQSSPPPAIRSTARLVQISVVVQDKKGDPITNLNKSDFTILDEGKPQDIAIFAAATPALAAPQTLLPPNVFTNRFDLKGQDPGAVTVVLFDCLNTAPEDQSRVRRQVLAFLQSLKPQDQVAIFALTMQLTILHEFTQDASALVNAASQFTPKELALFDASHPEFLDIPALHNDRAWMRFQERINQSNAGIADQAKIDRAEKTSAAIEAIANHLASIPGRKNLIWVSGSYPLQIFSNVIANDRQTASQDRYAKSASRALNRVSMAIYPVDVAGVENQRLDGPRNGIGYQVHGLHQPSPQSNLRFF